MLVYNESVAILWSTAAPATVFSGSFDSAVVRFAVLDMGVDSVMLGPGRD